jgi:hypothetical protein
MSARSCLLLAVAGVLAGPLASPAQEKGADPDVNEGIRLVEIGEYDAAILTLDNAARRLAADPARVEELSRAYLYLGIAYLGKGHEAAARARFRDAVTQMRDLTLSPEEFPPKVINLFEAAREDTLKAPGEAPTEAAPSAAPEPAAAPGPAEATAEAAPPPKKGSSKTLLILGGLGGAAAVGALALGGGGGDGGQPAGPVAAEPPPPPAPAPVRTDEFAGRLTWEEGSRRFEIGVEREGELEAELRWMPPEGQPVVLTMQLFNAGGAEVATGNRTTELTSHLAVPVAPGAYSLSVFFAEECPGCETEFVVAVTHP